MSVISKLKELRWDGVGSLIKDGGGTVYELKDYRSRKPIYYPEDYLTNTIGVEFLCERKDGKSMWIDISLMKNCEFIE